MIIRNPYGFYARHYKLIHLVLLLPLIYLFFCFHDIFKFFQSYISAGYSTPETSIAEAYINGYMFLVTFLLAIAHFIIFLILSSKKKHNLYYLICTFYFLLLLIALLLFATSMTAIEQEKLSATFANFVRDMSRLSSFPFYLLLLITTVKGVGFNPQTLRFDAGSDLKISEEDDEDVEINIINEDNNVKRTTVHLIRELKYYVLENQFVIKCIGVVLLLIIGYNLYLDFQVYNKTYSVNQAFKLSNFSLSIKDSYITNVDYRGNIIEKDKYYLVIKIGIENKGPDAAIDRASFRIVVDDTNLYPSFDKSSRFLDIGTTYQGDTIFNGVANDYAFVYELSKDQIKASYQMRILSSLTVQNSELKSKYKKLTIKPQNIVKEKNLGKAKVGQELTLKDTTLGKTTYKLIDFETMNSYQYSYEQCNSNTTACYNVNDTVVAKAGYVLIVLHDEIKWDETTQYYLNSERDFYSDFITLNYAFRRTNENYDSEYNKLINNSVVLKNVTPKALKDTSVYEVPNSILTAQKINMTLRVRNKYLTLIVKE